MCLMKSFLWPIREEGTFPVVSSLFKSDSSWLKFENDKQRVAATITIRP